MLLGITFMYVRRGIPHRMAHTISPCCHPDETENMMSLWEKLPTVIEVRERFRCPHIDIEKQIYTYLTTAQHHY
jgi:hypothetical protein